MFVTVTKRRQSDLYLIPLVDCLMVRRHIEKFKNEVSDIKKLLEYITRSSKAADDAG
jgi:3-deoxy-D-manno-octulosonic-acid transferase